jgi:hypothetical protein
MNLWSLLKNDLVNKKTFSMRFTVFLLFVCLATISFAQEIKLYKTFGGIRFERDSLILSPKQVHFLLEEEPQAYKQFKTARTNASIGSVLGFAGGLLIGIPLGTAIVGGSPEWGLALGGAALIASGIPFNKAFKRRAENALDLYNQKHTPSTRIKTEILWGKAVGIRLRF